MILTGWLILSGVLATVFATPYQKPMAHCANSPDVATRRTYLNGEYKIQDIVCADNAQTNQIRQSILEAKQLAQLALDFLDIEGVNHNLYQTYFPPGQANLDFVRGAFIAITVAQEEDRIFGCGDPGNQCNGGNTAYSLGGDIFYCPGFFNQGPNCNLCAIPVPVETRGGSTLHELAHTFNGPGGILDHAIGCPQAQLLLPPGLKVHNADNYRCFAQAVFALTGCWLCP